MTMCPGFWNQILAGVSTVSEESVLSVTVLFCKVHRHVFHTSQQHPTQVNTLPSKEGHWLIVSHRCTKLKAAVELTNCIPGFFYKFGAPKRLLTDQGNEFF